MVISILMVIVGAVTITALPVAQFPNIVPPEVQVLATYVGADAKTIEQSVATPIEQQMSGVDNMNYMYSLNSTADGLMRLWVKPDRLAKLGITVPEIVSAIQSQNSVNPAGQVGSEPIPKGQQFTYSVQAQGRMTSPEEFGEIIIRESTGGAVVRVKDVARVELGAQAYNMVSRLDGKEAAIIAAYQLPGSNAVQAANEIRKLMAELKGRLPEDVDYVISLDTTEAVNEGMKEIVLTLVIAIVLVLIVVFVFLQGWRATLIPLLAVPVSLVGTFIFFPLFGFSVNTLSLFGLVLAIGLVVDDAIVVVEAVERHIEEGLTPKAAALKAMEEISGPVIGIALVLSAVFI